jgi:L-iditol 2-dehydrogenase
MTMMKAAVLEAPYHMAIVERPIPDPGPGWVRLKNAACGICGSDMHIYTGKHPFLQPGHPMADHVLGNTFGHEIAGVVDAVGEGVDGIHVGDRASVDAIVPCHQCDLCRVGLYQICTDLKHYGWHHAGGFAEYTLVPAGQVVPIPEKVSLEEAALLDVLVVGLHASHMVGLTMADRVAILGAGPIGLAMAAVAKRMGAREIYITAKHSLQADMARRIGVDLVLPTDIEAATSAVMRQTDGMGVDRVLESVGYRADTMQLALELVCRGGSIVFTGVFDEHVSLNLGPVLRKEATIKGSHAFGMWGLVHEMDLAVEMLQRGEFPAKELVTHKFSLDRINEAFHQKLEDSAHTLKVQLTF